MGSVRNISTANGGPPGPRPGQRWGNWRYLARPPRLVLRGAEPAMLVEVPLAPCNSRTRAMGWVLHAAGKRWVTAEDVGCLVRALRMLNGWEGW